MWTKKAMPLLAVVLVSLVGVGLAQDNLDDLFNSVFNLTENKNTLPETTPSGPVAPAPVAPIAPVAPAAPAASAAQPAPTCAGECVLYYLCSDNEIVTDGAGIIDIRVGEDQTQVSECPHYMQTCCEKRSVVEEPPPSPQPTPEQQRRASCGFRNANGLGFRITGNKGGESEYGEFPWMVAVLREEQVVDKNLNVYECGASLIAPNVVLTAAHCVFNKQREQLLIRAGEWDTQTRSELHSHQDRRVAQMITHEAFNKASLANDVALLILTEPFLLAENVQPICLPPPNAKFDATECFASGWGKNIFGKEGKYQVILKKVQLPVVPHAKCQESLRTTRLGRRFVLHNSFLCAGGRAGEDTCRGDGGSPLVCPIPGSPTYYYQAGIVAWGIGCGENNIPGVYGNVAYFRDWIDKQLQSHNVAARDYVFAAP
ncbi:phenoloxidase-activating factor 2-like isoform X2 [Anopheles cruzii]|uniref:phenoloxidase-activating factor 2-like isoform X2 n=1 Tax=Anopheles cruzii TaxID=68878 RepID=UPI0022EC4FE1|nr:phenoloxidase-activating factor 2-like isoform X2 [Anopheles cruzii]